MAVGNVRLLRWGKQLLRKFSPQFCKWMKVINNYSITVTFKEAVYASPTASAPLYQHLHLQQCPSYPDCLSYRLKVIQIKDF